MILLNNLNFLKITKKAVSNMLILLLLAYFVFHSIYGTRGILAYFKLKAELENSHYRLEILRAERLDMENRAKLLRPDSLDIDMLDEKARNVLGIAHPNEKIFRVESNIK